MTGSASSTGSWTSHPGEQIQKFFHIPRVDPPIFFCCCRRGFERLLRKVLDFKTQPAVLNMHFRTFARKEPFFSPGAEDLADVLLKYYQIPSVSMRDGLWARLHYC